MTNHSLTIGWLYPDLMSTYGDRGNIIALQKRCEWRGIKTTILPITEQTATSQLEKIDLLFGGGAQDREQELVIQDLRKKEKTIKKLIESSLPALFVCGAPQLMGQYYEPSEGKKIEGLGIFEMYSKHPGPTQDRLIGNALAEIAWENLGEVDHPLTRIVGFENHGGRTHLGKNANPFAKIIKGFGNNGEDGTEGVVYKNAIGSYFHGPLLPKNPEVADWLIHKAVLHKYEKTSELSLLDDGLELEAHAAIVRKLA
ncbi:MAG TPA: cobalamin biosynthesis protein CobQ [Patescibacteria group bacterium]|nr:cobalamin biosynthesis protein CobQ [Patescibacteria group bacterium]